MWENHASLDFLAVLLQDRTVLEQVRKYVNDVFSVFRTVPMFAPAPYMYAPF
jgi:hypothetical protein